MPDQPIDLDSIKAYWPAVARTSAEFDVLALMAEVERLRAEQARADRATGFFREFFEVGGNGEGWTRAHLMYVAMWQAGVDMPEAGRKIAEQVIGPLEAS